MHYISIATCQIPCWF